MTNTLRGPVELTVKPGSSERYTVVPTSLRLKAGETGSLEVQLKVLRFAQRQKAVEQGHRDVFHLKVRTVHACHPLSNGTSIHLS